VLAWRMLANVAEDEEPAHAGAAALGV
jgi:hypothetical protein